MIPVALNRTGKEDAGKVIQLYCQILVLPSTDQSLKISSTNYVKHFLSFVTLFFLVFSCYNLPFFLLPVSFCLPLSLSPLPHHIHLRPFISLFPIPVLSWSFRPLHVLFHFVFWIFFFFYLLCSLPAGGLLRTSCGITQLVLPKGCALVLP